MLSLESCFNHIPTALGTSIPVTWSLVQRMLWFAHRMASNGFCVEGLVSSLWCCWKMEESLRGKALEEEVRLLKVCSWRGYWDNSLFLPPPPYLLPGHHEVNRPSPLYEVPTLWSTTGWNHRDRGPKQCLPPWGWSAQEFCYSNRKLSNAEKLVWN